MSASSPSLPAPARELAALRGFTGPPPEFWRRFLAALGGLLPAESVHLFHASARTGDPAWRRLSAWAGDGAPVPPPPPAALLALLDQAQEPGFFSPSPGPPPWLLAPLVTGDSSQRAVLLISLLIGGAHPSTHAPERPPAPEDPFFPGPALLLAMVRLAADIPADYLDRRRALEERRDIATFGSTLDLLTLLNEETRFLPAALLLCNQLASRFQCERVSLGWIRDHQARLTAISHTDRFDRRTTAVRDLELALEETADQDADLRFPPDTDPRLVKRDLAAYAAAHQSGNLCSLPLRLDGNVFAVLLCERRAEPFSDDEVAALRLVADQIARRLAELRAASRSGPVRWMETLRLRLARWAGPTHTWWKVASVAGAALLAYGLFGRLPYRVGAPFQLRAEQVAFLTSPFEAYLSAAHVEPGDTVAAGDPLFDLDVRELILQESVARATLLRHEREAEQARAADSLADMRIAEALAEQARAELAQTRWRLDQAAVTAPFAGAIIEADLKSRLGAPLRTGDVLLQVARLDALYLELQVAEADIHRITPTAAARVNFAAQPGQPFPAVVERLEPAARPGPQGPVFAVRCRFSGPPADWWRPGMEGVARVEAGSRPPLWILTHRTLEWIRLRFWW